MIRFSNIRLLLCQVSMTARLAACSIESALPELDYEISDRALNADWPRLVDQREFSRDYAYARSIAPENAIEALQERVDALRKRAERLQSPVIPQRDRSRLLRAARG